MPGTTDPLKDISTDLALLRSALVQSKRLEIEMEKSESRFQALFDASPAPVWIIEDHRFIECNKAAVEILGYTDKDALKNTHPSALSPEFQPDGESSFAKAERMMELARTKGFNRFEWVHLRADGSPFHAEVTLSPIELHGHPGIYCVWHDITERKQQQDRIRELLEEQRLIFENAQVGILLLKNRLILKCNQHIADMIGVASPKELEGQTTEILYGSSEAYEAVGRTAYAQLANQGFASFETELQRRDGTRIWALLTGRSIDPAAVFAAPSIWVYADITERKRADLTLQQSKQRFAKTFESCPLAASISLLENGCFIEVNTAYERHFGWTKTDLIGRTSLEVGFWTSEARTAWVRAMQQAGRLEDYEAIWVHKNGQRRYVSLSSEIIDLDGKTCILVYVTDITDRKHAEADLRIAAAAFDSQEGMVITDADNVILRVNQAFTELTGYAAEEVVGKKPNIFRSDRHDDAFYRSMWESIIATGRWQGEIWDRRKNGEVYPKWLTISAVRDAAGIVTHYIGTQFDITDRKQAEERIQSLAFYDQLTGLANRHSLNEQLAQAVRLAARNGHSFALMLLDLDNFKAVNDSLGHHVGDQLLVAVAKRLVAAVRHSDLVTRLGGDEFVILLPDITSPSDVAHVAEKILTTIPAPYRIDSHMLRTSPSIGICLYPDDATESLELLQRADTAMYHAKANGRNQYQFFKEEYQLAAIRRLALEAELHQAIAEQQFLLHYQPQIDLRNGRPVGVEALIRWQHPERGLVSPVYFIPIAEETGLILQIGDWVLEEACRQLAVWQDRGIDQICVSVNLTASQFLDRSLPARIQGLLSQYNVPAERLKLEVTESMSMASPEQTISSMKELTACGLSLSIDDFGTGYSSLAYLKLLPLSELKIDRSFVKDIETDQNDADICDVTVLLAHKLGLNVVAEGVETEAQLTYLLSIGCEKVQGYFFSRPLPAEEAESYIRNNPGIARLGTIDLWTGTESN